MHIHAEDQASYGSIDMNRVEVSFKFFFSADYIPIKDVKRIKRKNEARE